MDRTHHTCATSARARLFRRARALVAAHPSVSHVGPTPYHDSSRATSLDVTFNINLPSEWKPSGHSPSGVRRQEVVRLDFPPDFPMNPPEPSLRPDFNRNLPHMQPWLADGRPVPCVYDGHLTELILRDGLAALVNQIAVWLERAALGTLIDPKQGWEPVRRDSYRDRVIADVEALRALVDRRGGHAFLTSDYLRLSIDSKTDAFQCQISTTTAKITQKKTLPILSEVRVVSHPPLFRGRSLALVAWAGKHLSGKPIVADLYLPETVTTIRDLKERAQTYGCGTELGQGLRWLVECLRRHPPSGPFCVLVVLMARRPCNVIATHSPIEVCPYVLDVVPPDMSLDDATTAVRPAAHHHAVSRSLLVQLSGGDRSQEHRRWTLVGAGSLGSKLALHLARAGNGPEVIIDKSSMTPHNAARHALVPTPGDIQILWTNAKAIMLCDSLRGLDHTATPIAQDAVNLLAPKARARGAWSSLSWAVVNATASVAVREAFAAASGLPMRVIETSLFAGGQIGLITVEGSDRNPNTNDLMAEFYSLLAHDGGLSDVLLDGHGTTFFQNVGQGCGSLTMTMSDGRLSLFAASMAESLLAKQRNGLPDDAGELIVGKLSTDGLGLEWQTHIVPPVAALDSRMDGAKWQIHIHQRAADRIRQAVDRWPQVETGGVLIGRLSEYSRTVHIVDILDAPEDSQRSASCFVLGTVGLRERIDGYAEATGWSLYCLGTWHSHLNSSGPSDLDKATATAVSMACLTPAVALIRTPEGYHVFLTDADCVPAETIEVDV